MLVGCAIPRMTLMTESLARPQLITVVANTWLGYAVADAMVTEPGSTIRSRASVTARGHWRNTAWLGYVMGHS